MLFDGLKAVELAMEAYKNAQIDFFKQRNDEAAIALWQAKDNMDAVLNRMSDLEVAKRIINEMENKGIEI